MVVPFLSAYHVYSKWNSYVTLRFCFLVWVRWFLKRTFVRPHSLYMFTCYFFVIRHVPASNYFNWQKHPLNTDLWTSTYYLWCSVVSQETNALLRKMAECYTKTKTIATNFRTHTFKRSSKNIRKSFKNWYMIF